MTEEVKPCPFCGGTANIAKGRIEFWAYCPHCGATTEFYETEQEAADAWNARPIEDAQADEIKRLREALEKIVNKNEFTRYFDVAYIDGIPMIEIAQKALKVCSE